jgi:hypothetical protein
LSWTVGLNGNSISLKQGKGIFADFKEGRTLLFQRGPYLIYILAPSEASNDKLISFGNGFQV